MSKIRNVFDSMRKGEDPGFDRTSGEGRQQSINPDGTYNVQRKTGRLFGNFYLYHWLITTNWLNYWIVLLGFYVFMNVLFATIYFLIGVEELSGIQYETFSEQWINCFFFSAQSFTTVGYGGIHPVGYAANAVAVSEAFIGLMTFAIATGTLYGRFSRPVSKLKYSANILLSPFKEGKGLMFMVANQLDSSLVEMEARVLLSWTDVNEQGKSIRRFQQAKLEIDRIAMFPTNWVVNHIVDEESMMYGKSIAELKELDFEVFILMKGFDDVFSQYIYSRHSYRVEHLIENAKFIKPFYINEKGKTVLEIKRVGEFERLN